MVYEETDTSVSSLPLEVLDSDDEVEDIAGGAGCDVSILSIQTHGVHQAENQQQQAQVRIVQRAVGRELAANGWLEPGSGILID